MKFDMSYEELDAMIEEKVRTHDIEAYRRGFQQAIEFVRLEMNRLFSDIMCTYQMIDRDDYYDARMERIFSELKDKENEYECETD